MRYYMPRVYAAAILNKKTGERSTVLIHRALCKETAKERLHLMLKSMAKNYKKLFKVVRIRWIKQF